MAQKKENLPVKVDVDLQNGGTITYATEVIATIAGVAANEVEGIAGMCVSGGITDMIGRNRNITKGVKVEVGSQEVAVDLFIIVEYGQPIQKVASDVQENVRKALESLTGMHVVRVDVHVQGVSFEKEKKANQNMLEAAQSPALADTAPTADEKTDEKPAEAEQTPAPATFAEADDCAADCEAADEAFFDPETLKEEAALEEAPTVEETPAAEAAAADEAEAPAETAAKTRKAPGRKRG